MIGKQLGNYLLLEKIGEGGMAVVYKAEQTNLKREVAIKILPPQLSFNEQFVKRFHREALAVARLNHPGIVQIFDVGQVDDVHYFAMEYVSETNLAHYYFERNKVIEPTIAADIGKQIAEALDYAHGKGIIHRDIKPANILMTSELKIKVTDFGIAHLTDSTILTSAGTKIGTPKYMSPEQARGEQIDGRSDIYSLGIILYEIFTGCAPFKVKGDHAMLHDHIYTVPPKPRSINPELTEETERVILKCLEKKADDRYQSGAELAGDLELLGKVFRGEIIVPVAEKKEEPAKPTAANGVSGIHRLAQQKYMAQTKVYGSSSAASPAPKSNQPGAVPQPNKAQTAPSTASLSPTQLYQQADQMVEENRLKEARDAYREIIRQYPNEAKAHFQVGYISSQLGDHNLVVPHYLKAVSQKTDYFEEAHIVLGQAYLNSKHYAQAINEFKTVLTKSPQNRDVRVFYDIASFSLVLSKNPNSAEAHNGLGYAYYQRKDYSKALAEYLKAVKLNPNYSSAYFNLGVLYFNIGRFSDAKIHYLKAVGLDPGHANYHFGLGLAYYKLEERRRAYKEWKQTIKLDPDHVEAKRALEEY